MVWKQWIVLQVLEKCDLRVDVSERAALEGPIVYARYIAQIPREPVLDERGLPSGDQSAVEPPGPIPNPEVKRRSANGSGTIGPVRVGRRQVYIPPRRKMGRDSCFTGVRGWNGWRWSDGLKTPVWRPALPAGKD